VDRRTFAAALLFLAAGAAGAAEEPLGTLFLSADERARLDALRRGDARPGAAGAAASREPALTGYVQRSDGRTTVWIDGKPVSVPARQAPRLEPGLVQDYAAEGGGVRVRSAPR
jgi:hypothetical protein